MTTTAIPTPSPASSRSWRYRPDGGRDLRLDLMRGYALAAMSINHFGLQNSWFHQASGRSSFLLSAAEAFLFISGFTLGWISVGRPAGAAMERLWKRTWVLYLATTGVSLGFAIVALQTDWLLWAGFDAGDLAGPVDLLARIATLRIAIGGVDILVAYVFYLLAAIAALRLMEQGRSWIVASAVTGLYVASQFAPPGAFGLGFASFRVLVPNAPLFFGGLLLGYHRDAVADAWRRVPFHRAIDLATVAAAVALGFLHARGWQELGWLGDALTANNPDAPLWARESEMPIGPLVGVLLFMRAGWLIADRLFEPIHRFLGWLLLPLGEAALFTFVAHLVAIPVFLNLPGFPVDEGVATTTASIWVAAYLGSILAAVHVRRHVLAWLRSGDPTRAWFRQHGPAVVVAALCVSLFVAGASPSGQAGDWGGGDDEFFEDEEFDDEEFDEEEAAQLEPVGAEP